MATRKRLNVDINLDYLEVIMAKSGLEKKAFWEKVGRSDKMTWNVKKHKAMSPLLAQLICNTFGAEYNRLVVQEKAQQPAPTVDSTTIAHIADTIERMEARQNDIVKALCILKERQDELHAIMKQLL